MKQVPFMFDAGKQDGIQTYVCGGTVLNLTKEDYDSFEQNKLDDSAIKVMAFSFLSKQLFQDFSSTGYSEEYYEL